MKKIVALLMALCLLGSFALAESVELNWADVEGAVADAGIEGNFAAISDIGVKMFIPTVFQDVELSDEDVAEGYLCVLSTEDESATVYLPAGRWRDDQGKIWRGPRVLQLRDVPLDRLPYYEKLEK